MKNNTKEYTATGWLPKGENTVKKVVDSIGFFQQAVNPAKRLVYLRKGDIDKDDNPRKVRVTVAVTVEEL